MSFRPELTAARGQLYSRQPHGTPVHAGSFIRKRSIILDSALQESTAELQRILVHELFHFVWVRFGNPARAAYGDMISSEFGRGARGELGWSAEWRKAQLGRKDIGSRRWREYLSESFCDTAAWLYAVDAPHEECTLASRYCRARRRWLESLPAVLSI